MSANQSPMPQTFAQFWPWYMAAHQDPRCRRIHYVGSAGGLVALAASLVTGQWWLIAVGIVFGYACAWYGHFVFEHNKPASWVKPWWSFLGDWKMFGMWIMGREGEAVALGRDLPGDMAPARPDQQPNSAPQSGDFP